MTPSAQRRRRATRVVCGAGWWVYGGVYALAHRPSALGALTPIALGDLAYSFERG